MVCDELIKCIDQVYDIIVEVEVEILGNVWMILFQEDMVEYDKMLWKVCLLLLVDGVFDE